MTTGTKNRGVLLSDDGIIFNKMMMAKSLVKSGAPTQMLGINQEGNAESSKNVIT